MKSKYQKISIIMSAIMTFTVGVATIWSFIHSKKVEDRLLYIEELKFKPDIRIERDFNITSDCDNNLKKMYSIHINNEGHKIDHFKSVQFIPYMSIVTQYKEQDTVLYIKLNSKGSCELDYQKKVDTIYTIKNEIIFDKYNNLLDEIDSIAKIKRGEDYYRFIGSRNFGYLCKVYYKDYLGNYVDEYFIDEYNGGKYYKKIPNEYGPEHFSYLGNHGFDDIDKIDPEKIVEVCFEGLPEGYYNGWFSK